MLWNTLLAGAVSLAALFTVRTCFRVTPDGTLKKTTYNVQAMWWWWGFPRMREFREYVYIHSSPAHFFFKVEISSRTNFTLQAWISPQWLSELRWLWPSEYFLTCCV